MPDTTRHTCPYQRLALDVQAMLGHAIVAVNTIDADQGTLHVQATVGFGATVDIARTFFGGCLKGYQSRMTEEAVVALGTGALFRLPHGMHDVMFRRCPVGLAQWFQQFLGVKDIYVMGLLRGGRLVASLTMGCRDGQEMPGTDALEPRIREAAARRLGA